MKKKNNEIILNRSFQSQYRLFLRTFARTLKELDVPESYVRLTDLREPALEYYRLADLNPEYAVRYLNKLILRIKRLYERRN